MSIIVIAPDEVARRLADFDDDVTIVRYHSAADAIGELGGSADAAIIVSDGLRPEELPAVAEAVRASNKRCIEVRGEAWDGTTFSPLSAACRGAVSGFGPAAVARAVELLRASA
jgi:hypothetical protein